MVSYADPGGLLVPGVTWAWKGKEQAYRNYVRAMKVRDLPKKAPVGLTYKVNLDRPSVRKTASAGNWKRRQQPSMPKMPWED